MEASDCVYGGNYRSGGAPQPLQEKKAAGGDHFVVEDLLDFSNEEAEGEEDTGTNGGDNGGGLEAAIAGNSAYSSTVTAVDSCNSSFSGELVCRSVAYAGDLCEPYDDLAELEWLSNFVEESFSSEELQKLQLISGVKSGTGLGSGSGSGSSSSETREGEVPSSAAAAGMLISQQQPSVPFFLPESSTVPGKARSKRSRAAPCNWSSRLLVLSPTSATSSSDSDSILLSPIAVKKSPKPTKKKEPGLIGPALMASSDGRRCLHCATEKTPQWRTGPMGPKTLCNACGVRYKSGRLVPEYRPAASPTFVLSKHSNSHRKVLELRRQKEMQLQQKPFMGPVASYFNGGTAGSTAGANADEFLIHHHLGPDLRQMT